MDEIVDQRSVLLTALCNFHSSFTYPKLEAARGMYIER
jgi:hypothetical protein